MATDPSQPVSDDDLVEIDLKDPRLAALLAWLWPGAGHLYQGRTAKGILFMVSILSLFFFGLGISGGHAVYASFASEDFRFSYLCQLPVGVPAFPALVQDALVSKGMTPLLGGYMAPPTERVRPEEADQLADWQEEYGLFMDLGITYTMIAGMLNIFAIFDAFAGPAYVVDEPAPHASPNPGTAADGETSPAAANSAAANAASASPAADAKPPQG